jgi:hypothetical protein
MPEPFRSAPGDDVNNTSEAAESKAAEREYLTRTHDVE